MSTYRTKEEIILLLEKVKDIIDLDWSTYIRFNIKARFIDKEFGEWRQTPRRVLVENRRHPKRAALNRAATNIAKYGTANVRSSEAVKAKTRQTNLERYGGDTPMSSEEVKNKIKQTNLDRYGATSPLKNPEILEKLKQTNLTKYGVTSTLSLPGVREKLEEKRDIITAKCAETNLAKYGNKCSLHGSNQQKTNDAFIAKYGVANAAQVPEVIEKIRETFRTKYGTDWVTSSQLYKDKYKQTSIERYGVDHPFQAELVKAKIRTTQIDNGSLELLPNGQTKLEWFLEHQPEMGFSTFCTPLKDKTFTTMAEFEAVVAAIGTSNTTKLEDTLANALSMPFFNKKCHPDLRYKPDFKINDSFFINADGLYWHCERTVRDNYYHFNMRAEYEKLGLTIWQFRSDEIETKIDIITSMVDNRLGLSKRIYARKTTVDILSSKELISFIDSNHMMGIGSSRKNFVLKVDNEVVAAISYKTNKQTLIIDRFCSKAGVNIIGGFSKLLARVIEVNQNCSRIEYWVDLRYGTGTFLSSLGFDHIRDVLSWQWTDTNSTKHRLTSWANPQKVAGWYKIYDAGQRLWVKELKGG